MTFSHRAWLYTSIAALTLSGCSQASNSQKVVEADPVTDSDVIPHAMLPDNVTPTAYRIDMVMNPDDAAFKGVVEIDVEIKNPTRKIWLHGKTMTVNDAVAKIDGADDIALSFTELPAEEAPSGVAYLSSDTIIPAGSATLRLPYSTPYNLALDSAYKTERDGEAYIVTQFESLGAREAFPSFDEPRFKIPFTISITAPKEDVVIANTPEVSSEDLGEGWIKHNFATSRPLPTYLIAFAVGPYDVVEYADLPPTEVRDRPIKLRGIGARGTADQFNYGLENTAGILEALESYFGIPYPYEKLDLIAAPEYAYGAMENPGAIVYLEYLMLLGDNAPLRQKRAYARVHSHELAHQWFGNLVTPFWWEDIWLNEAFATWMGNKGTAIWNPEGNFDRLTLNAALGTMNLDALANTRQIRTPLERSEKVIDQFDSITYRKGGGVLSMFESFVGEEKFRDGVRLHMDRFADDVATADDFFQSIADASKNPDVVEAMKSFVDQPGLPLVSAEMTCSDNQTSLSLSQSRYAPLGSKIEQGQTWQIPVCAKFGFGDASEKSCVLMKGQSASLKPETGGCADWVTLNENGSGYYRFSLDAEGWQNLLNNIDAVNSREALTIQDSLEAAFRAGEVEPSVYLDGMVKLAAHPEYDVSSSAGDLLAWMDQYLPESSRSDLARLINDMYRDRFNAIRDADTVEGNLLAPTLATRLTRYARDPELQSEFAAMGAAYLGLDGEADKQAIAPKYLTQALSMTMAVRGEEALNPLLALVKSGSALEKSSALSALSKTTDPDIAASLRDLALNDADAMTGRQASSLLFGLISSPQFGQESWQWLQENFDLFLETRIPATRRSQMPNYANGCSVEARDKVEAFFGSKTDLIPGYELPLVQNLEAIELCAARKEQLTQSIAEALAAR